MSSSRTKFFGTKGFNCDKEALLLYQNVIKLPRTKMFNVINPVTLCNYCLPAVTVEFTETGKSL